MGYIVFYFECLIVHIVYKFLKELRNELIEVILDKIDKVAYFYINSVWDSGVRLFSDIIIKYTPLKCTELELFC